MRWWDWVWQVTESLLTIWFIRVFEWDVLGDVWVWGQGEEGGVVEGGGGRFDVDFNILIVCAM